MRFVPKDKLRFFCDNCGIEVARNAKACPQCGKSFGSVRCPVCGFSGALERFKDRCPVCGYHPDEKPVSIHPVSKEAPASEGPVIEVLPLWVYIVTVLALIGTVAVVVFTLRGTGAY
ncbi:MAG: zinc ribbon domain-containing protein [Treponema sp.]|jgi:predicted RNA-binding Zn-ribbon protein involved in translation (DUF1610 family)|nr:zinc ribbon domain-containing protein [Treponema sp.]